MEPERTLLAITTLILLTAICVGVIALAAWLVVGVYELVSKVARSPR